jgi:hypothetical protein
VCQAGKQFSAVISVICKVCQAGKQFSAVTPVICKLCQAGKQFSAVTPVICKVCQRGKRNFKYDRKDCRKLLTCLTIITNDLINWRKLPATKINA